MKELEYLIGYMKKFETINRSFIRSFNLYSDAQTMEKRNEEYFICTGCFHKLISFVFDHPKLVKVLNLPEKITIHPMPTDATETCERCTVKSADGFIPLAKPKQVVVN